MNYQNKAVPANESSLPCILFFGAWYMLKFLLYTAHDLHICLLLPDLGHIFATMVAMSHFSIDSTDGHKFSGGHTGFPAVLGLFQAQRFWDQ